MKGKNKRKTDEAREQEREREGERKESSAATPQLPRKKYFRQRAHANPFSDHELS